MKNLELTDRKVELLESMIELVEQNWVSFCTLHEERAGTDEFADDDLSEIREQVYR